MEPNKTIFGVMKSESDKINIIINNTIIMLSNRVYIDKEGSKVQLLDPVTAKKNMIDKGENTFIIKASNGDNYALKIVFQKISAVGKQSLISEFFREYEDYKKIIVASDFNNKIIEYVSRYQTQIFLESALLRDIISYRDLPKFELLSPKEMEEVKRDYNVTDYTILKIPVRDPVVKYYALKKGDIIRVIRPSPTSGYSVTYRIVY
jgi:DNA-directed RNA polymerase subunit H (RpoH/RPB5)